MKYCLELFLIPDLNLLSTKIDFKDDFICQGNILNYKEYQRFVYHSFTIKASDEIVRLK